VKRSGLALQDLMNEKARGVDFARWDPRANLEAGIIRLPGFGILLIQNEAHRANSFVDVSDDVARGLVLRFCHNLLYGPFQLADNVLR
jgi:hypothetical protein